MKILTAVALLALSGPAAFANCVDISGRYHPPYENAESDRVTTLIFQQYDCRALSISGFVISKPPVPFSTVFGVQRLSLEGRPAPQGFDCLYNSAPGACASYKAGEQGITKIIEQAYPYAVPDTENGICFYTESLLSKDANGNLVEQPVNIKCDNGYNGPVAPIIWPKAQKN